MTDPASSLTRRVRNALDRSREEERRFTADPEAALRAVSDARAGSPGARRSRRIAIGDPQAPVERFFEILDRHDLLDDDGRLHEEVLLVSMGDHFDWGAIEDRDRAATSGYRLLSWLASHPDDQVVLMANNHDLARVGELVTFDDTSFAEVRREALALRAIPISSAGRAERRHAFLSRWRVLPSVGVAARDWGTFEARQRDLVAALLRAGRYRAAWAADENLLLVHAALTPDDLELISLPPEDLACAPAIARAVDGLLERTVASWNASGNGDPLSLDPLYRPGSFADGEARGIFVQRPADPETGDLDLFRGPPRRRFDPRILRGMPGLTLVVGHIRDNKCRDLMPRWHDRARSEDGPLRHLWTDGETVRYARGPLGGTDEESVRDGRAAAMLFADGGMNFAEPGAYELVDLDTRRPAAYA
ncbi:MAG: metallophosphoesterase [Candidatus Eiseniibacteriota bacterium]